MQCKKPEVSKCSRSLLGFFLVTPYLQVGSWDPEVGSWDPEVGSKDQQVGSRIPQDGSGDPSGS